jgi:hypothetical protein
MRHFARVPNGDVHQVPINEIPDDVTDNIRQALSRLRIGEITILVSNETVVQIDQVARKRQYQSQECD